MQAITIEHPKFRHPIKLKLSVNRLALAIFVGLVLVTSISCWVTYKFMSYNYHQRENDLRKDWQSYLSNDYHQLQQFKHKTENQLTVISEHVGRLSAHLVRINALGERLIEQANLDPEEFDFNQEPGMGGPLEGDLQVGQAILQTLVDIEQQIDKRFHQFEFLEDFFHEQNQKKSLTLTGRGKPITKGWVSSFYGRRVDPFTGKKAWHNGVDIAGREGDEVLAVATGIVSLSENKGSYGQLIEINHGDGFATRYAHNKKALVKVGDLVKKGQPIALVGSTGRSTGPHVHLEVRKKNKSVDPGLYFHDLRRRAKA